MSGALCSVLLRDVERVAALRGLDAFFARKGYERVDAPARGEAHLLRALVRSEGRWTTCILEELEAPESLAKPLSKTLGCVALASWYWDGESVTRLVLFEGGTKRGELELPRDARPADGGKVALPLGKLSRLVGDGARADGLELRIRVEEQGFVFVRQEEASNAFRRAFGVEIFPEADLDEEDAVVYRPTPGSAIAKRHQAEEAAILGERREAYDARVHAVGWLGFAVTTKLGSLLEDFAAPLAVALDAYGVLEARVVSPATAGTVVERDWRRLADALARSELVELKSKVANLSIVHAADALLLSFSVRGHKDPTRRRAMAATLAAILDRAVETDGCFGALLAAQKDPLSLAQRALAFEYLRGTSERALRPVRTAARAPGWRTLAPNATGTPPSGFTARATKSGLLVASDVDDPWALEPDASDRLAGWLFP